MNIMEMICIKKGVWTGNASGKRFSGPRYLEVVTVVGSYKDGGDIFYLLKEYAPKNQVGKTLGFWSEYFVPTADISELTEILAQQPQLQ